jgi:hypothetical protein
MDSSTRLGIMKLDVGLCRAETEACREIGAPRQSSWRCPPLPNRLPGLLSLRCSVTAHSLSTSYIQHRLRWGSTGAFALFLPLLTISKQIDIPPQPCQAVLSRLQRVLNQ